MSKTRNCAALRNKSLLSTESFLFARIKSPDRMTWSVVCPPTRKQNSYALLICVKIHNYFYQHQDIQHIIAEYEQRLSSLASENSSLRNTAIEEKLELQRLNDQYQTKITQLESELKRHQEEKRALKLELEEEGRRLEEKEGNFLVLNEEFRDKLKELEGRMSNENKNLQFKLKKYEEEEVIQKK